MKTKEEKLEKIKTILETLTEEEKVKSYPEFSDPVNYTDDLDLSKYEKDEGEIPLSPPGKYRYSASPVISSRTAKVYSTGRVMMIRSDIYSLQSQLSAVLDNIEQLNAQKHAIEDKLIDRRIQLAVLLSKE